MARKRKGHVTFFKSSAENVQVFFTVFVKEEESACSMLHVKAAYWKR